MGRPIINLKDMRFGRLVVLERVENRSRKHGQSIPYWKCKCDCGTIKIIDGSQLREGSSQSCGCLQKELLSQRRLIDLTGKRFGRLLVLGRGENATYELSGDSAVRWNCICDCGNYTTVLGGHLKKKKNQTASCGCLQKERARDALLIDLTGKKFGKLTVISRIDNEKSNSVKWICKCDCGNTIHVFGSNLKRGGTVSCGCSTESIMASYLKKYFSNKYNCIIEYKIFKNPETNHYLSYDIYLSDYNIFIEVNGTQHYQFTEYFHRNIENFKYSKKLDRMKRKFARKNGKYIEIDLRKIKTKEKAIAYIEKTIGGINAK